MYYYKEMTATYYDSDQNNLLKLSGMLRYMQQTSSEQLQTLGVSPEKLFAENMVFLLSKTNLKVERYPACTEQIRVGTAATHTKGARFIREFVIDSMAGERLVSGYSLWVLTDIENHKILRPKEFPYTLPFQPSQLEESVGDIAIPREKDLGEGISRTRMELPIRYSHLDVNRHVNNAMYADFICDAIPYDELCRSKGIRTLALSFVSEARHGDVLSIETARLSEGRFRVAGTHARGTCFEALAEL